MRSLLFLFCSAIFIYWVGKQLNSDLWYDEVCTFNLFVMKPWDGTLFNYIVPNNHVFYSIILQCYTRIFNLRSDAGLVENIVLLRSLGLFFSIGVIVYTVKLSKLCFKNSTGYYSALVLLGTIPLLNFSLQIRGYMLSALFVIMIVYHSVKFIRDQTWKQGIMYGLCTFLVLYTIPSNLYIVAAWLIIISVYVWVEKINFPYLKFFIITAISFLLVGLVYLPIWREVLYNKYTSRPPDTVFYSFTILKNVLFAFLSERYLLLIPFFMGLFIYAKEKGCKDSRLILALIALVLVPFVLSFLHYKKPYERTFLPLIPIASVVLAFFLELFSEKFLAKKSARITLIISLQLYSALIFYKVKTENEKNVLEMFRLQDYAQNIFTNYYLADTFKPKENIALIKETNKNLPVFIYNQVDIPATELYLKSKNLSAEKIQNKEQLYTVLEQQSHCFLITTYLDSTIMDLEKLSISHTILNSTVASHNILLLKKRPH